MEEFDKNIKFPHSKTERNKMTVAKETGLENQKEAHNK